MFVGLNPSTADETNDDPTIRRCIAFAKSWGHEALCMTNLYAFRATDPNDMFAAKEPIGAQNDSFLRDMASRAGIVIAAWGVHGAHRGRGTAVQKMLSPLHVLKLTKDGHPSHPLYLKKDLQPFPWVVA